MRREGAYLIILVNAIVVMLVDPQAHVRVGAYLIILVNAFVVTFVDPEAYEKGRSVPHNPCERLCCHVC